MANAWARRVISGVVTYVHSTGARVERLRARNGYGDAKYHSYRADGSIVRVRANADGTPYIPRPWHETRDMPVVHYFSTAEMAKRAALTEPHHD